MDRSARNCIGVARITGDHMRVMAETGTFLYPVPSDRTAGVCEKAKSHVTGGVVKEFV